MSLAEITYQTIQKRKLIPKRSLVVVGVSGGVDSLVLLHLLHHLQTRLDCHLHVATLNHGLRGQAGADDAHYVEELARSWGLPVTRGQVTVTPTREGIEAAARTARYDFLASVARQIGATHLAVGHHAGDQAETVLMRLLRGASLQGIRAMTWTAPVPADSDLTLIRPLLDVSRDQIELYAQFHGLQPREDATNTDATLLRNRIRHEILPFLTSLNPQLPRTLLHLADSAAVDDDYLQRELERIIQRAGTLGQGRVSLSRLAFRDLHPALQRRWVSWAAKTLSSSESGYDHITAAVDLARRANTGAVALLPGGLRLRLDYDTVVVEHTNAPPSLPDQPLLPPGTELTLTVPDVITLPSSHWQLAISASFSPDAVQINIPDSAILTLRTRRPGDHFAPPGLNGRTRSIKDWMIDHKIPRALRDHIPLLVVNEQIAAIIAWPQIIIAANDLNGSSVSVYFSPANVTKHNP